MKNDNREITIINHRHDETEEVNEVCETQHVHKKTVGAVKNAMPDEDTIYDLAELFKVFGDSTRTKIISALFEAELCVCDICAVLSMTKSAVSHQLNTLRAAQLVKYRRDGKNVYYSLDDQHVTDILERAMEHLRHSRAEQEG